MLSSIEILILGAIQGISEFLPVSSAAHLVLVAHYSVFNIQNLLIDICLHLGSLLAIITYFIKDLLSFIKNFNRNYSYNPYWLFILRYWINKHFKKY